MKIAYLIDMNTSWDDDAEDWKFFKRLPEYVPNPHKVKKIVYYEVENEDE